METLWKQFGSIDDLHGKVSGELSGKEYKCLFKSKLLDLLPALNKHAVIVRADFVDRFSLKKVSSWMIQISRCKPKYDKFLLLQLIQQIEMFSVLPGNRSNGRKKCHWTKLFEKPYNSTLAGKM